MREVLLSHTGHGLPSGMVPWFLHQSQNGSAGGVFLGTFSA
jgi:hypothetical protein